MANRRIYLGNNPWESTEDEIRSLFTDDYKVVDLKIITDKETGRPRGFAFVELATEKQALDAATELDGQEFGGRFIRVREANERPARNGQQRRGRGDDYGWK